MRHSDIHCGGFSLMPRGKKQISRAQVCVRTVLERNFLGDRLACTGQNVKDGVLYSVVTVGEVVASATKKVVPRGVHLFPTARAGGDGCQKGGSKPPSEANAVIFRRKYRRLRRVWQC